MTGADLTGEDGTLDWRTLLGETAATIGDRQQAWWLCEVASGYDADELISELGNPATQRAVAHLDAMVDRLRAGEPLQYVLGRWAFRRLDLAVDSRVLIPRPETEQLVDVALELLAPMVAARDPLMVADLGTGSGAIGLALADELPVDRTTVWLTDADEDALHVARANAAGLGRPAANVRVAPAAEWFDALDSAVAEGTLDPSTRFDLVASNPPYVAEESTELESIVADHEPHRALFGGPDGLDHIRVIIGDAPQWLHADGWLVLEIGADQGPAVQGLLTDAGWCDIAIRPDAAGHNRIALARHV